MEYRIQKGGIGCGKLLGTMNIEARDKVYFSPSCCHTYSYSLQVITSFKEDPEVKVLLISLKAGG